MSERLIRLLIGKENFIVTEVNSPEDLAQGLGGISELLAGSGMLFDMGMEQFITVTTEAMLFPLDIAFLSEAMEITEVYHNVQIGCIITSSLPARYFLEVNAGELGGIE
jgi:uncharacterized membrane protein (UPF0127 family)